MRIYSIFYCDKQNDGNLVFKHQSTTEANAIEKLEKYALEFIKNEEGAKHTKYAFQDSKTLDGIRDDAELRNGMYLKNADKMINVYEKKTRIIPGTFYNGEETIVVPVGYFCVIKQDIDVPEQVIQPKYKKMNAVNNAAAHDFISTLKQMFVAIDTEGGDNLLSPKSLDYQRATFKKPSGEELKPVEKKYLKKE